MTCQMHSTVDSKQANLQNSTKLHRLIMILLLANTHAHKLKKTPNKNLCLFSIDYLGPELLKTAHLRTELEGIEFCKGFECPPVFKWQIAKLTESCFQSLFQNAILFGRSIVVSCCLPPLKNSNESNICFLH